MGGSSPTLPDQLCNQLLPVHTSHDRSVEGLMGSCLVLQGTLRRRPSHLETQAMWGSRELLLVWFLVLAVGGTQHIYRPG